MTVLFLKIVNMSIAASFFMLAVLVLRPILRRLPKWVPMVLWAMVALRLICPFSLESAFSLVPTTQTIRPEIMMDRQPQIDTGIPVLNQAVNPVITESFTPNPAASANPLQILIPVAAWVWLAGMAAIFLYTLVSYWLLRRRVAEAVLVRANIFQSQQVQTPFVLGLWKPRIYIPWAMSKEDMRYVLYHERCHIRRRDHWWKPLGFALVAVHWFNPLAWLSYILFCRDMELACDESVIKALDPEHRGSYAQALLSCSTRGRMGPGCPVAFGEVGVKTRIKSILSYRRPAFWILLLALVLCILTALCFLTDPEQEPVLESQPTQTSPELQPVETTQPPTYPGAAEAADLSRLLEMGFPNKAFQSLDLEVQAGIREEYGDLLDGYTLIGRQSSDGMVSYLAGFYAGDPAEDPFRDMREAVWDLEEEQLQILYREDQTAQVEQALAEGRQPEEGWVLRRSRIRYSYPSGYILILPKLNTVPQNDYLLSRPNDDGWKLDEIFRKYQRPNGRAYLLDAYSRGIALTEPESPYLEIYLISETWGEICEYIPLTEAEAAKILLEPRVTLEEGWGFTAILQPGPISSLNLEEEAGWFTDFRGVPQTVLDLAIEMCGYQFASPRDIQSPIVEARLEGSWLEEPCYVAQEDLPRLQSILQNAEFGYVGACGYGGPLTITMADGSTLVLFKGTDGCDSILFGSYGGYFLGERENTEFWQLFGLDPITKQPIAREQSVP